MLSFFKRTVRETDGKVYIAIDLKSFYASVECMERGLDPLDANLVVADESRTEKTICLAVSPALKAYGIPGRARLFEALQAVEKVNASRLKNAPGHAFCGSSTSDAELRKNPGLKLDFIIAPPHMSRYMNISKRIFNIYQSFVAPEDIHVYSIDEVFIDATAYLKVRNMTAHEFAMLMIRRILQETRITATAGIGTNLYLAKIAMDIVAKKMPPDKDGVRVAELDEMTYRRTLWDHRPLTDFWRVGKGYARKLEANLMYTMGDIARCSLENEELLYKLFGVNAELLIDHAWGWEPCTIKDIKAYEPESHSFSSGQVLKCPYSFDKARIIVREMAELLSLDLIDKRVVTDTIVLTVCYDRESLSDPAVRKEYEGKVTSDWYGRTVPPNAHGTAHTGRFTSSSRLMTKAALEIYDRQVDPNLLVRRIYIVADNIKSEGDVGQGAVQTSLFDPEDAEERQRAENEELERERRRQKAMLSIQKRYGKNSILKGISYEEGATTIERNSQIGGHRA